MMVDPVNDRVQSFFKLAQKLAALICHELKLALVTTL